MVCSLPTPRWLLKPGLISADQNIVDQSIVLNYGTSAGVPTSSTAYYLIYFNSSLSHLFDAPQLLTTQVGAVIPSTLATPGMFMAVTTAQLGASSTLSVPNFLAADPNNTALLLFPSPTTLAADFNPSDGYVVVNSIAGFPSQDGYLLVGDEVIEYDTISSVGPHPAFHVSNRDPFGCNLLAIHLDGYSVSLFRGFENREGPNVIASESCALVRPSWVTIDRVGLISLEDLGDGSHVVASWDFAKQVTGFSQIYYILYQADKINKLYDSPIGITTSNSVVLSGVQPNDGYYYGLRASYYVSNIPTGGMTQIGDNFFAFPHDTSLAAPFNIGQTGTMSVNSTVGYPASGLLRVGSEVMQFGSKTSTSFQISRRDIFSVGLEVPYRINQTVQFFRGVDDGNQYFLRMNTSWDGYGVGALPLEQNFDGDGYWGFEYLQDPDGYRNFPTNVLSEDHTIETNNEINALPYDYCGFRNVDLRALYTKNLCGTFQGGFLNGFAGGINVFDANNQRQELIIGVTGEPFILLSRKTTGRVCRRISHRNEHPHQRTCTCFGTMFEGGYDRYLNPRILRPGEANPNGLIQVRVSPYMDQLILHEDRGLSQEKTDLEAWTLALPIIKDRDILIRYIYDQFTGLLKEEFRYEVFAVTRNKLVFSEDGAQKLNIKRLNPTEEIYKFKVDII